MAKTKIKKWWIIYEDNSPVVRELTFKEVEKTKLKSKFSFDAEDSAERYLEYLNTRYMEED